MHAVSLMMLAFIGPARSLFLPVEGNPSAFHTVGSPVVANESGILLDGATLHFSVEARPEGIHPEGTFRFVGAGEDRTLPAFRGLRWKTQDLEARVIGLTPDRLEIQFLLPPGSDPDRAFLRVDGATLVQHHEDIAVVREADTLMHLSGFRAFQGLEERPLHVHVQSNLLAFDVAGYDPSLPLVIDPITAVITGSDTVEVKDVKVSTDSNSVYAAGVVFSYPDVNFSVNPVVFGTTNSAGCAPTCTDAFVTHLSADLSTHLQTVVLASSFNDVALDLAVESSFVAVAGWTDYSYNFATNPTVFGTQGGQDAFVVVMDSALSQVFHTFIVATPDTDQFWAVDFDEYVHIYAGGFTRDGNNVPVSTAPHIFGTVGGRDAFAVSLSIDPVPTLMGSAVLGGRATSDEELDDLVKEPQGGFLYATGQTTADSAFAGGPQVPGWGYNGSLGGYDAFYASLPTDFTSVDTWVEGTSADEFSRRVVPDPSWSRIYFAGYTSDASLFTNLQAHVHGPPPTGFGGSFVVKTYPTLQVLDQAVLTGASGNGATGLVVTADRVVLAGKVYDPQTFAPNRQIYGTLGGPDVYVTVLDTSLMVHHGSAVLASSGYDQGNGLDLSPFGFVVGGYVGAPSNFAENPPMYFYGNGNTGRRGFVSLLPGSEVAVSEGRPGFPSPLAISITGRTVALTTSAPGYLALEVRDVAGRLRWLKVFGFVPAGTHRESLALPAGMYLLRVRSQDHLEDRKILIP